MHTTVRSYLFSLALLLFIFHSCDDVDVDPTGMGFSVILNPASNASAPGSLQFDEGFIRISEIEFEGENSDDDEIEIELEQHTTIDLVTGDASPPLDFIAIPAGTYEEFEVEIQGADDGDTVIFLKGVFIDSAQNQLPVEVIIKEQFSLELEWENYTVDTTIAFGATFLIDPTTWFQQINLQDLMQADTINGVVIISPDENINLYDRLTGNLSEGIEWEWDD